MKSEHKEEWGVFREGSSYAPHLAVKSGFTNANKANKEADMMNKRMQSQRTETRYVARKIERE